MDSRPTVKLFGRPDCHLCDEARSGLGEIAAAGHRFELLEIDIESDDELFKRYLERIPVIEVGGDEICDLGLDRDAVIARLATVPE